MSSGVVDLLEPGYYFIGARKSYEGQPVRPTLGFKFSKSLVLQLFFMNSGSRRSTGGSSRCDNVRATKRQTYQSHHTIQIPVHACFLDWEEPGEPSDNPADTPYWTHNIPAPVCRTIYFDEWNWTREEDADQIEESMIIINDFIGLDRRLLLRGGHSCGLGERRGELVTVGSPCWWPLD